MTTKNDIHSQLLSVADNTNNKVIIQASDFVAAYGDNRAVSIANEGYERADMLANAYDLIVTKDGELYTYTRKS